MTKIWKILVPVLILGVGFGVKQGIEFAEKEPEKTTEQDPRPTVRTQELTPLDYTITITSYGEVVPSETTQISAQVAGVVVDWHPNFVAGGIVKRGDKLFSIERDAYVAAKLQAEAEVNQARATLIEEQARADVAAKEASSLASQRVSDLYLRKPQILSAQARLKSAEAKLKLAERDLRNTVITAPYDALIVSREIGVGQFVNVGTIATTLHNIESAEVIFPIAGFDGQFLPDSMTGQEAQVITRHNQTVSRIGTIHRDLGLIDQATRMTNLVVKIDDPYALKSTQLNALKFGTYVEINFDGKKLRNVFKVKQDLVNNNRIWTLNDEQKLVQKQVTVIREEGDYLLIDSGLEDGESIVLTVPEYPQNGMDVVVIDEKPALVAKNSY